MRFYIFKRLRGIRNLSSVLIVFLFLIGGCGGAPSPSLPTKDKPSLPAKKETVKVAEKKEEEKKEEPEYTYNPAGKPDPFKPFLQLTPVREVSRVPLTPLQKYEISQLKLVAIISSPEGNIAMVEDSAGKGYFLKKGTLIGKNDGKVTKILKDKVIVEEVYLDIFGQTKTHEISILLHRMEEGEES
ncbi:MAG: pilus assembly protein PilP [Thermodesulfobacteriota bacterium]